MMKIFQNNRIIIKIVFFGLLCLTAFGVFINQLGFYWDDWQVIYLTYVQGEFSQFYAYNRPFSAWAHAIPSFFLGVNPLNWQIAGVVQWFVLVCLVFVFLTLLWPNLQFEVLGISLLFSIHPAFSLHPLAVTFTQHYLTYILFLLSLISMMLAFRIPKYFFGFLLFSIATAFIHTVTMEYFWGLELIRPILIWKFGNNFQVWRVKQNWLKTILLSSPFLVVFFTIVIWRMWGFELLGEDPNQLSLVTAIISSPFTTSINILKTILQDVLYLVVVSWYRVLTIASLDLWERINILALAISVIMGIGSAVMLSSQEDRKNDYFVSMEITIFGFLLLFFGMLPIWIIGRQVSIGMWSDRFALPGLLGASVLVVSLLQSLNIPKKRQIIVISIMIGLSVGAHLRVSQVYRWEWVRQTRVFWQVYWRAPSIEPNTAFLAENSLFSFTGDYPTSIALNLLYGEKDPTVKLPYWFFEVEDSFKENIDDLINGKASLDARHHHFRFKGNDAQVIILYDDYENGNCLWLLDNAYLNHPHVPRLVKQVIPLSNLNLIQDDNRTIPVEVFGDEVVNSWCYFFEKAEMARQKGAWDEILALGNELQEKGLDPNNKTEWYPFVIGLGYSQQWVKAAELTINAYATENNLPYLFCPLWNELSANTLDTPEKKEALTLVMETLNCKKVLGDHERFYP